jgi:molybdopterin-binding protein
MTELLRIGEVAAALGVSVDTLRRWETEGRVAFTRRGNRRMLPADQLRSLLEAQGGPPHSSARNHLPGIVVAVVKDTVMAKVELACGDHRIVSLMSREAADDLGLEPGKRATAVIKATTVIIEA